MSNLNISYTYVIVLVVAAVLLLFLYIIARVHTSPGGKLQDDEDCISVFIGKRKKLIRNANMKMKISTYIALMIICPIGIGSAIYIFTSRGLAAIVFGLVSIGIPRLLVEFAAMRHTKNFEEKYARSLEQLASGLGAGMSILQAVEDVAECKYVSEKLRHEYQVLATGLKMGVPVPKAFRDFAEAVNSPDAKDVALAIEVQDEIGGREAETILEISRNIHKRIMLRKEVRTIFSSTSTMIKIMNVLGPGGMLLFAVLMPDFIEVYFSSPTLIVIFIVLVSLPFIGILVTRKMLKNVSNNK